MYHCILCASDLTSTPDHALSCQHCGQHYPAINGIRVFIPDAAASLQGYLQEQAEAEQALTAMADKLTTQQATADSEFSARISALLTAITTNRQVLATPYQAIRAFLQANPQTPDLLAWSMIKTGTTLLDMLPYFYQDWADTADFAKVAGRIAATLNEHHPDKAAVAVLGAGACGLLHSIAPHFDHAYGVDLSLPTLLAAQTFMAGEPLHCHLPDAHWQAVTLTPPAQPPGNIELLTANVNNLPFKNASLSVVITQYMLDIVSNPLGLAQEIRRVLKPDGLWLNFSKPFRIAADLPELGMRNLAELPPVFTQLGYAVINLENHRFTYLNLEKVSAETDLLNQLVHYFVLRKTAAQVDTPDSAAVQRFFIPNAPVWQAIPRLIPNRPLIFTRTKTFDGQGGVKEALFIKVMGHTFAIPTEFALLLESLFAAIDGQRNLRQLFQGQQQTIGLDEAGFLKLIYILHVLHYLLEF
jgi:SAM-dependent methyltransferase/uncharacterized protein YbaR (Trm112 family)